MHNSRGRTPQRKPKKPSKRFPLFPHASGMWAKKIKGRLYYFGSWRTDPKGVAALEHYTRDYTYLQRGDTPPPIDVGNGLTIRVLVNDFLASKDAAKTTRDLARSTFALYYRACEAIIDYFGPNRKVTDLSPQDFREYRVHLAKKNGPVGLRNAINLARILFNHAYDNNLIDRPVRFGTAFEHPTAKVVQADRNEAGDKLFERHEVLRILNALEGRIDKDIGKAVWRNDPNLKAMVLLALNGGLGNSDVGNLRESHLTDGWIEFPRVKTSIPRRIPLWPETLTALEAVRKARPDSKESAERDLIFLTRLGQAWTRTNAKTVQREGKEAIEVYTTTDSVSYQFAKLLKRLKINGRRRLNFYCLRHCFETYAGECRDQIAVNAVMGHVDRSMSANYRHRISDERLRDCVETVRRWLFGTEGGEA